MSDIENQYDSPQTKIVPEQKQSAGNLTETMLHYLRGVSPWLRFFGIVEYIMCGFLALVGILFLFFSEALSGIFINETLSTPVPGWLGAITYLAIAVVSYFPARFTYKTGTLIRRYQYSSADEDLEQAFKNNKSLWKFNGIIAIISLSFIPIILIVSFIIGIAAVGIL